MFPYHESANRRRRRIPPNLLRMHNNIDSLLHNMAAINNRRIGDSNLRKYRDETGGIGLLWRP